MKNLKTTLVLTFALVFGLSFNAKAQNNFMDFNSAQNSVITATMPPSLVNASQITMEFWVHPDVVSQYGHYLNVGHWFRAQYNNFQFAFLVNGTNIFLPSFTLGEWQHLAIVFDGTLPEAERAKVYRNGILEGTHSVIETTISQHAEDAITIGNHVIPIRPGDGQVDEVRVWSTPRTQSQIQDNMNSQLTGAENGLVAYYNFNQGTCGGDNTGLSAPQVPDITGNGFDATITNMTLNGCASNFVCEDTCNYTGSLPVIPTMGEWALIIFGLIMLSFGVVSVMRWQKEREMQVAA